MLGTNFSEVKLKRSDKVKSLPSVNKCFKIRDDVIPINPQQLFNRMICIVTTTSKLEECLCYELSSYPTALFDEVSLNRGGDTSKILVRPSGVTFASLCHISERGLGCVTTKKNLKFNIQFCTL